MLAPIIPYGVGDEVGVNVRVGVGVMVGVGVIVGVGVTVAVRVIVAVDEAVGVGGISVAVAVGDGVPVQAATSQANITTLNFWIQI